MKNKNDLLNKLLNSMAEEYFSFNNKIIKVNNLKEVDFQKIALKIDKEDQKYYIENNYLIDQDNVYFNKESVNLLKYKIQFLGKIKSGQHKVPYLNNYRYQSLSIDLDKGLDLLKKYQKNNHNQASFLHYKSNLLAELPEERKELLLKLAAEAAELGYNLYLVGGQVRDLLINLPLNKDLDLLLDGDLKEFFDHLEEKFGYQYDYNNKFSTGFLHNEYGYSIDIASCREEKYHFPGSLPLVEKADLFSDLFRRDFTINTLVIDLHPDRKGILYDFFGGINDLKNGILKVLHNYSFRDDPLRILRGIRFQILKDFKLSAETVELSRRSLKNYDYHKLALERVFTELAYLFDSKRDISQFSSILLNQIPVLKLIKDNFEFNSSIDANFLKGEKMLALSREKEVEVNHFLVRLMILFYNSKERIIKSWPLSIPEKKTFIRKNWQDLNASVFDLKDPALRFRELESYQPEELIMFTVQNFKQEYVEEIFNHLQQRDEIEIPISGHDLLKMGVAQGPEIREYLLEVRDQILRRQISSRREALEYLKEII
ncbi:tRNA nucleotidyltransferase/poly(A) polymerase family protein [Halanaerobium kushneri]|jgi:poly(A) polymerase/tRNA nucleotidyltransferase (CCA-adding enzyme)|uniref:Poly(A) polymerase/tRNA nucleotidyltransferase (CCA-adding enzyme) n=1 Tax=Halanaerobium kushneri TaxID=56779 RepID=A0A1N6Q278_9FIRM|nr:CCA tRNA nucleotidyltransferase [Halanaerobium kushneri]SIQ10652.1 poly(A) polymerase/tRNA nucleotidyltransferase (CCA-adding enzyme) [Halanaerobium kushneri]